ncbi:MAG: hypothetical protein AAB783_00535 [Patescibacteria group bacterium]
MSIVIGAEAAKLAGLQIDILAKLRCGQMTFDQLERFSNLSPDDREVRFGDIGKSKPVLPAESTEKFGLLVDLGIITVPDDYDHATRLSSFGRKNRKKFYYYNDAITDANFPNPSRILKPGEKFRVRAFKQIVPGTTTSEERIAFLATQGAIHTGAQGVSLVFDQKRDQLAKGYWYASFDEPKRLWEDADGNHGVPSVDADSDGGFRFGLGDFGDVWDDDSAFLCLCDLPAEA